MDILHVHYSGKQPRALYLLYLGSQNDKLVGIDITKFSDNEKKMTLSHIDDLDSLPIDKLILWFKTHCPTAYKTGLKQIYKTNVKIIDKIPLNKLKS